MGVKRAPVLTPEDHQFFVENGYVVVKRAVPPDVIAAAVRALEEGVYAGKPGTGGYRAIRHPAVDACVTPVVLSAVGELFGEEYPFDPNRQAADMPRPREAPGSEWKKYDIHIDDDYPTAMPGGWAVGTFIFLTPVRHQGGAFILAAGSPNRYRAALADRPEWLRPLQALRGSPGEEYLAESGDLLLFHHLFGHTASTNVSDPQTRHALLARWHPYRRIVPGGKPFERMTTIEKVNSAAYVHDRFGLGRKLQPFGDREQAADLALRGGFAADGGIRAHVSFRYDGDTHLLYVAHGHPDRIGHVSTTDWTRWTAHADLKAGGPVKSLHWLLAGAQAQLFAGLDTDAPETEVYAGGHPFELALSSVVPGASSAHAVFTSDFGSKRGSGDLIVYCSAASPALVLARRVPLSAGAAVAPDQEAAPAREDDAVFAAPEGRELADALLKPVYGETQFALVADVSTAGNVIAPHYVLSSDSLRFEGEMLPLRCSTADAPRQIRVYARARSYWMVTFLHGEGADTAVSFGTIDWGKQPVELERIDSAAHWVEALYTVGAG